MKIKSNHCVTLEAACSVLYTNPEVQAIIKQKFGATYFPAALNMMMTGKLEGALGGSLHDLLADLIRNDSEVFWSGFTHHPHGNYSLCVYEYHGVFWVHAIEFDPIGYFIDEHKAISFAYSNWENVYADGEEPESEDDDDD